MQSGFLKGYKTYILAGLAILGALAGYGMGDLTLYQMLEAIWAGGVAAAIRDGVNTAAQKSAEKAAELDYNRRMAQQTSKL